MENPPRGTHLRSGVFGRPISAVSDREPVNSIFNANRKAQDGIVLRFSNRNLLNVNH
jgi:hypothetical protein